MCQLLTYSGIGTCCSGRSTPSIHWAMPAQSFRASVSVIDDICLKSIVVFRYLVDRPISRQPHRPPQKNTRDKPPTACQLNVRKTRNTPKWPIFCSTIIGSINITLACWKTVVCCSYIRSPPLVGSSGSGPFCAACVQCLFFGISGTNSWLRLC